MNKTIELVLSLTLSGSILAILILGIKPFIKDKLSKSVQYYIWLVVLIRLALPFSFEGSIMNDVFQPAAVEHDAQVPVQTIHNTNEAFNHSSGMTSAQQEVASSAYSNNPEPNIFLNLFNQFALYVWMLGAIVSLMMNVTGYARFSRRVKGTSIAPTNHDLKILASLLSGRRQVRLVRNHYVSTPMLIGILRPSIIIPDYDYSDKQLKNILLHELVHLRRWDLAIKWFTMIVTSIHWFNPLMYFIKKEIHFACELACDEAVIKNLNAEEKQAYGDTLISIAAGKNNYAAGALQVTMDEEKNNIKERLVAIMNFNKKPTFVVFLSSALVLAIIISAALLGASVGKENHMDQELNKSIAGYIVMEGNLLYIDEVEVLTTEYVDQITGLNLHDPERMAELNLTEADMPNGYYIHPMNMETRAYKLTNETAYTFTDFHLLFVEDADGDRLYKTTNNDEFIQHLTTSFGSAGGGNVPYFIEVNDGKVVSITEKFIFTQ